MREKYDEEIKTELSDEEIDNLDVNAMIHEQRIREKSAEKEKRKQQRKESVQSVGRYFSDAWEAFTRGDVWVKLSSVLMGAGYFARKQIINGLLVMLAEAGFIFFIAFYFYYLYIFLRIYLFQ